MRKILLVATAAAALIGVAPAFAANDNQSLSRGGSDFGPMGQCFDARACGYARGAYGFYPGRCHMVRERIVTDDGSVIFRRHRVCD